MQLRKSQLADLDQLADAERTSRAALVREAIDRLLKGVKRILTRLKRPS
jgi:hypothetical protein